MAPDRSERPPGKVILRNPLRGLRYSTLGLMVLIIAGILYVLTERTRGGDSGPPLASLETGEGVAQRALNLDVKRTRRGLPSLKVSAKEALTYRDGSTTLHDVAVTVIGEDRKTTEITAPVAVSGAGSSGGWSFKNGVELKDDEGFRVEVPEIDYHETPQELSATGSVSFSTGAIEGTARGLRYLVGRRIIEFPADVEIRTAAGSDPSRKILSESARFDPRSHQIEFRRYRTLSSDGETLSGTSLLVDIEEVDGRKVIRSLHSTQGFRAYLPGPAPPGGGAGGPGRLLTGDALDLSLDPSGRIDAASARGGVRLTDGDPNQDPRTISCNHLEAALDQGAITSITASGSAHLRIPARQDPQGEMTTLGADRLVARFAPGGRSLQRVEAETGVIATHGDRTLKAPHVAWETASGLWTLRGEGDLQASVTSPSGSISADSVDLDRPHEVLDAHGHVRTAYLEKEPGGDAAAAGASPPGADGAKRMAGLLGSGDGPLHAMSDALHLVLPDRKAHYTGNVRIWRGGGSIEAATVDYSDADGLLEARDHV
ncbi:MAG TPA: hypothetical protein VNI57_03605, partial [Candidatus Saccharimonadales bacterium]|nr:hypothetical protein [Candidatus Saccharimonadales bacterium]